MHEQACALTHLDKECTRLQRIKATLFTKIVVRDILFSTLGESLKNLYLGADVLIESKPTTYIADDHIKSAKTRAQLTSNLCDLTGMVLGIGFHSFARYVGHFLVLLWWRDGGVNRRVVTNPFNICGFASRCKFDSELHVGVTGIASLEDGGGDSVSLLVHNIDDLLHLLSSTLRANSCGV